MTDSVEKVLCGECANFWKAADTVHAVRCGDHVSLRKIGPRSSQSCRKSICFQSTLGADQNKIFAVSLLSTFSTQSEGEPTTPNGRMSACDLGGVKTLHC